MLLIAFIPQVVSNNLLQNIRPKAVLNETFQNNPPYEPSNPVPNNGAIDVSIDIDLSWTGGDPDGDDVLYDVYFGDYSPPPKVVTKQSDTTYDPGILKSATTYYWKIISWDNQGSSTEGPIWDFPTESINPSVDEISSNNELISPLNSFNTSVDKISPYNVSSTPLSITATGPSDLDNVTLYYRWSNDNATWDEIYDPVDSNTSNIDNSPDIGNETNFPNAQDIFPDFDYMNIQENNSGGSVGCVVSVERVDFTLSGTTTSTNDLTKGQDYTQCVPFATRQRDSVTSNANSDDYTANCVDVEIWDNSGTAAVRVTRTSGLDDSVITVYVVEFSSDINVQQGSVSSITGTGTDVTIASVDQTKAFALFYYQRSGGQVDAHDSAAVRSYFSSDTVLRLNRAATADGEFSGHWYVIEDTGSNWDVQSGTISLTASDTTATDSINSVNMAKTFTIASMETTQADDDVISGTCRVDLQSSTSVRAIRNAASDTITVSYFAV